MNSELKPELVLPSFVSFQTSDRRCSSACDHHVFKRSAITEWECVENVEALSVNILNTKNKGKGGNKKNYMLLENKKRGENQPK